MAKSLPAPAPEAKPSFQLDPAGRRVFIGLMLGMLVASISQTIVGPAMPRIVAELGGMDHYSWLATAAMLVSAITVPIAGKLSDLYGRRPFYIAGLAIFLLGSLLSGLAPNFWMLVAARGIQGLGMGTLMPLSQTIIGDIVPARFRGKYQAVMGAVFGVTSIVGPLAGGFITDFWGWRWLFFVSLPIGVAALVVITRFLHLPHTRREVRIDYAGMVTLAVALTSILLATSFGGTTWPWASPQILGLYAVGAVFTVAFIIIETRAEEPVLPLRLFRSSIFTLSNLASFGVAMMMFGAIIYIPVYAQGVMGVNAAQSGLILMPLMLGMIVMGMIAGFIVTKTGRYKEVILGGAVLMIAGYGWLFRLSYGAHPLELTGAMTVFGIGLGLAMQQYTLVVQNNARRQDLGVATSSIQFFRNVGSTVGIAIFGTVMTTSLPGAIARHLPPGTTGETGPMDAGSVLDPAVLSGLPAPVAEAIRMGLAESLHNTFLIGLPLGLFVLVTSFFIKAIPLRETIQSSEEAGREILDAMAQSSHHANDLVPLLNETSRTRERITGLQFSILAERARQGQYPLLLQAVTDLGGGDPERGIALLERTATMLSTENDRQMAELEEYAAEVAAYGSKDGGVLSPELRRRLAVLAAQRDKETVLSELEPTVSKRFDAVNVRDLQTVGNDLNAALLVDLSITGLPDAWSSAPDSDER
ncbi:DHA2 family efflux MFS transporter permease subunit [Granulicoccus sp. GXG6511]|uniref:DHA2 family efflux MFS transporter permease subunit n=1 Tax=Granulicoccus sp. GXG6511 TaxID=3381351 RepID=UPI003D7E70C4